MTTSSICPVIFILGVKHTVSEFAMQGAVGHNNCMKLFLPALCTFRLEGMGRRLKETGKQRKSRSTLLLATSLLIQLQDSLSLLSAPQTASTPRQCQPPHRLLAPIQANQVDKAPGKQKEDLLGQAVFIT